MKSLVFILILFSSVLSLKAQKVYYIYFESENRSSFYVKMGDNVFTSNTPGYLTISSLKDSTYKVSIGFPNIALIGRFNITINTKDKGFIIKNQGDQMVLFDLETQSIIKPIPDPSKAHTFMDRRNDEFTTLLSKAANDTSLLYVQVADKQEVVTNKEEKPAVTNPPEVKQNRDSAAIALKEVKKPVENNTPTDSSKKDTSLIVVSVPDKMIKKDTTSIKKDTVTVAIKPAENKPDTKPNLQVTDSANANDALVYKRSKVIKHSESSTSEGFGLIFFDNYMEGTDTIRLIIPNPKYQLKQNDDPQDTKEFLDVRPKTTDSQNKKESKKEVKKNPVTDSAQTVKVSEQPVIKRIKPACTHMADNNDFFKLRKNMAAKENDESMINEAKKYFRTKCFTTEQIKNLSALFLTAAGKYEFFDAAYQHVSDQESFSGLQTEIKDDYYYKRFKALIGE